MKYATWAVAILLCFFFGRIMYSPLSGALLPQTTSSAVKDLQEVKFGSGSRELRITIDLRTIDEREMPGTVELKKRTVVSASGGAQETPLEKGSTVTVSRKNGYHLEISAGGPLTGLVPIADTDFAERVIAYRARRHFGSSGAVAENTGPSPTPPPTLPQIAKNEPPAPGPAPAPAPAPAPGPAPAPAPEPAPAPGPDPEKMEPEDTPESASLNAEQIVSAMQESVKSGSIKEFKFEQVEGWKAGEEESVDGESYQTGLAAYKAQTIFGEKTVQAKALIKGGKVVKWIYAKTGMEIR